jgi:hypothetical protein
MPSPCAVERPAIDSLRCQRAFGWALVEVPYWEWQSEWDIGQRSAYLERKISAALSTQLKSRQLEILEAQAEGGNLVGIGCAAHR